MELWKFKITNALARKNFPKRYGVNFMPNYQPKVLVIDDQPGIRKLLTEVLEEEGYAVSVAANGYEAVPLAAELHPDVILMDMKMPGMNGLETLMEIKRQGQQEKIIVMTAYGEMDTINEVLAAGIKGYLTKPFDIRELCAMVKKAVLSTSGK